MASPLLTIVVGTYNRRDQIQACLESIARETKLPYVTYVTDAGSTDGTVEYLQSVASERVRPILVGKRLGQAKAYNDVFAIAETPYICWISDDNVVVDNGLDKAVCVLQAKPRIGMVALKVRDKAGPFTAAPYIGGISSLGILNVNQGMLPTGLLRQVGGFSESFRDYGIDPDLTAKVLFSGYDVVYLRDVAIHHYRNWSTDPASPEYRALQEKHQRSLVMYEAKYGRQLTGSASFTAKRWLYGHLTRILGQRWQLNSQDRLLGQLPRDWHNIFMARFISLADPLVCAGEAFHLRQRWPRFRPVPGCPPDPVSACR